MNRGQEQVVCDRRILKAFYTQYVAVLLIILVFAVGAFQRAPSGQTRLAQKSLTIAQAPTMGTLQIAQDFDSVGSLVGEPPQLRAIASVIREHDIRALVTVPIGPITMESDLIEVEMALARIDALKEYFLSQGLPEDAFQFFMGGVDARDGTITIQFQDQHHDNLPL